MRETELYPLVKGHFEALGFQVRGEVRDIDTVAVKDDLVVGIELKEHLNVAVLTQATLRQKVCDLVYVAVAKPKRVVKDKKMKNLLYLLRRLELGLLYVDVPKNRLEVVQEPAPYDLARGRRAGAGEKQRIMKEMHRRSVDGNAGGITGKRLLTAYREDALKAVALLELRGEIAPKELKAEGLTPTILRDNYYGWFHRLDRGRYALHPESGKDYAEYKGLVEDFKKRFQKQSEEDMPEADA